MRDGVVSLEVAPMGLVSLRIPGIVIETNFAQRVGKGPGPQEGRVDVDFPDGDGRAYLLSAGENLTHAYVFVRAKAETFTQVRLQHRVSGDWQTAVDDAYPFEFSIRVQDGVPFEFKFGTGRTEQRRDSRSAQASARGGAGSNSDHITS